MQSNFRKIIDSFFSDKNFDNSSIILSNVDDTFPLDHIHITFDEKDENIMHILNHLPEELKEIDVADDLEEMSPEAPSRARSRTRSPDPRYSPLPQASPRARVRGGAGGGGYSKQPHLSELLDALHALL